MQAALPELFTDPKMRLIWWIAGVVAILTGIAYKFGPEPRGRVPAPTITPSAPRSVLWPYFAWMFFLFSITAGLFLNIGRIKSRHGQSAAGWLLIARFSLSSWSCGLERSPIFGFIANSCMQTTPARSPARIY